MRLPPFGLGGLREPATSANVTDGPVASAYGLVNAHLSDCRILVGDDCGRTAIAPCLLVTITISFFMLGIVFN